MKKNIFALLLVAGTIFTACKEDGDEPEIFNNTTWYPVRTVGEYQVWEGEKISYDFSPKPLTIFTSESIRIGNAFYKKR